MLRPAWKATFKDEAAAALFRAAFSTLEPPPALRLSEWAEREVRLPAGRTARAGAYRNWPYLIAPLDDIGDLHVEQITFQKPVRVGFSTGLIIGIGAKMATDPCPIGLLVPTDDDARNMAVDQIEPVFESTPALDAITVHGRIAGRNTLTKKSFVGGGSLSLLSARSPRNLRMHTFKVVYGDEVDAMQVTTEGDPLALIEKRTLTFPDRKLVWGSTPTEEGISNIERKYQESDQRVFEIPCPHCGHWFELKWAHVRFDSETVAQTEEAYVECPANGCVIEERDKRWMVEEAAKRHDPKAGLVHGWRITRPDVTKHHGYRMNALVSLIAQTRWGQLAAYFLRCKRSGPSELQVFVNTILGETWATNLSRLDADVLRERVERFGLDKLPRWVVLITAGVDVQDDRLEMTLLGWGPDGMCAALAHIIIEGNTLEEATWEKLDKLLRRRFEHPNGWSIGIDATAIDSGGSEGRTQKVYDFCDKRNFRRIYAIKGMAGARPMWARAAKPKKASRLHLVGHDVTKTEVMTRLAMEPFAEDGDGKRDPLSVRFSEDLPPEWFDQVTNEVRRIKYVRNRPVIEFVVKREALRTEALDATCYAWAVRKAPALRAISLRGRAARKPAPPPEQAPDAKAAPPKKRSRVADWSRRANA